MSEGWSIYRARFPGRAKQLTQGFTFTDALGRDHSGQSGDYFVQFSESVVRIIPREIFEDIYVILAERGSSPSRMGGNRHPFFLQSLSA